MQLTIVTDHRFYRKGDLVYDDYVFNYNFFKAYLEVFEFVNVVARVQTVNETNENWVLSSGDNVVFLDIPDIHGLKWIFFSKKHFKERLADILATDCFCFRVPSIAAWEVLRLNKGRLPYMFESIGDPEDSMLSSNHSWVKRKLLKALGKCLAQRKKVIVQNAKAGSYVSVHHLQEKYPVKPSIKTQSISSIRLKDKFVLTNKSNLSGKLRLIHVGSFIPLKNQRDIIYLAEKLYKQGTDFSLDLIGQGPLLNNCKLLVKEIGLDSKINFHGQIVGFENIVRLLDQANVFIIPSYNEGMPRALIEAMARGLICVGSQIGGVAELLDEEFTFECGNLDQMTSVINSQVLHVSDQRRSEISRKNIETSTRFVESVLNERRKELLQHFRNVILHERSLDSN